MANYTDGEAYIAATLFMVKLCQASFINNTFIDFEKDGALLTIFPYDDFTYDPSNYNYVNASVLHLNTTLKNSLLYNFYKIEVKSFSDINSKYKNSNFNGLYVFH